MSSKSCTFVSRDKFKKIHRIRIQDIYPKMFKIITNFFQKDREDPSAASNLRKTDRSRA